jgi:U3 small nucleolar RNA-associated protein 18
MTRTTNASKIRSPLVQQDVERPQQKKEQALRKPSPVDDLEEERLTALLFGTFSSSEKVTDITGLKTQAKGEAKEEKEGLFELDTRGDVQEDEDDEGKGDEDEDEDEDEGKETEQAANAPNNHEKPAWVDDDDVHVDLNATHRLKKLKRHRNEPVSALSTNDLERRLRHRFERAAMANWVTLSLESEESSGPQESTSASLLETSDKLPSQILQVVRCPDANQQDPNQAVVQAVHFHPASDPDQPLLLTAGLDKTLRFFHITQDSKSATKVHGVYFPKLPIYAAQFLGHSGNVIVCGRRPFFYLYDTEAGKLDLVPRILGRSDKSLETMTTSPDGTMIAFAGNDGYVVLVDVKSKQWVADLKLNGSVRAMSFTTDSNYLLAGGSDGQMYRFDIRTRRCVESFSNHDGTTISTLAASFQHVAVGAESGVLNLYSQHSTKQPLKSLLNLTTSIDGAKFNHDGQILAFSTRREQGGLRLLHVPSQTVFSNWPTSKTPLNFAWSLDFSPESKYMAIGNDQGHCLLYKLLHYHRQDAPG